MKSLFLTLLSFFCIVFSYAQNLQVSTIVNNINASGGVTIGPDGNIYASDYGPGLGAPMPTKVYTVAYGTWDVSIFADGFPGASGSCFDAAGNFYQSSPFGKKISKIDSNNNVDLDWATEGFTLPIGIQQGHDGNFYVCDCTQNQIIQVTPDGNTSVFADSPDFACPNGLTIDPEGILYACNFTDGKVLKITPEAEVTVLTQIPQLLGGPNPIGAGHLTWKNDFLFVTAIGRGEVYKVDMQGNQELIAGVAFGFSNNDGPALQATFSKPNGIAASITGDTLFLNVSDPTWPSAPQALHPAHLRMITGVCSLPDVDCPLLTSTEEAKPSNQHLFSISPNPSRTSVTVTFDQNRIQVPFQVQLIDSLGQVLKTTKIEHHLQPIKFSLEDVPSGIFWVQVNTKTETYSAQLIVE